MRRWWGRCLRYSLTGTKDPNAPDLLYITGLAAPHSVNTMPEKTLRALADHGDIDTMLPHNGGDAEAELDQFTKAGVDIDVLAATLQQNGAASFVKSWDDLLARIAAKSARLKNVR